MKQYIKYELLVN